MFRNTLWGSIDNSNRPECNTDIGIIQNYWLEKKWELKGPTDFRPASNSYPVKVLQRDVPIDAPGPSELIRCLCLETLISRSPNDSI